MVGGRGDREHSPREKGSRFYVPVPVVSISCLGAPPQGAGRLGGQGISS